MEGVRRTRKRNIMQAFEVTKLEILPRTVTFTPGQLLSDEQHRKNVQPIHEFSQKNITVLM